MNLLERRIEQYERFRLRVEPQHAAGRPGAYEQITGLVERECRDVRRARFIKRRTFPIRRDLVNDALLTSARKDVAFAIDGQRPDVLFVGIEERRRRTVAIDPVNL